MVSTRSNRFPANQKVSLLVFCLLGFLQGCGSRLSRFPPDAALPSADVCDGSPTFTSGQAAQLILGQTSTTVSDGDPTSATASSLYNPGKPVFLENQVWISDQVNNRILGFDHPILESGVSANLVLGQSAFVTKSPQGPAIGFNQPAQVQAYGGKLYVLDSYRHRLLEYSGLPTALGEAPSRVVVGQTYNISSEPPEEPTVCGSDKLYEPTAFLIVEGKLLIVDSVSHRILIWNQIPTLPETPADIALGQAGVDACFDDGSGGNTPPTAQNTLNLPIDLASDGQRLVVADSGNHRVLIWNEFPTENQQNADFVLGQPIFTSGSVQALSGSSLRNPSSVELFDGKLYVADKDNQRVLIWNTFPSSNYISADVVIGQPDFVTATSSPTASTTPNPIAVRVCGNRLYVSQEGRVSIFEGN